MSLFGIGAAAVANIGASLLGGSMSNSAAAAASKQQHEWNVDDYKHRYQWSMQDMQAAGLNPILAATQGIGGSINGASALSNSYDLAGAASGGVSADAQKKNSDNGEKLIESTNAKNNADAKMANSSAAKLDVDAKGQDIANRLSEASYESNLAAAKQNAENAKKQGQLIDAQTANAVYQRDVVMPAQAAMAYAQGNAANSAAAYHSQNTENARLLYKYQEMKNDDFRSSGASDDGGLWSTVLRGSKRWIDKVGSEYYSKYGNGGFY